MKEKIKSLIEKSTSEYLRNLKVSVTPPIITVEIPRVEKFGEYSSNIAIQLAGNIKNSPHHIAQDIARILSGIGEAKECFSSISAVPQGFINFTVNDDYLCNNLINVLNKGEKYGRTDAGRSRRVLLEYVSANPTGPLHVGHGRWAVIGGDLANILKASGYRAESEFYVNDVGNQIEKLISSIEARMKNEPVPEGGYGGDYIKEIALKLKGNKADKGKVLFSILSGQKRTLERLGVVFDRWFNESSLYKGKKVQKAVNKLKEKGATFTDKGALWFKSTEYSDDRDRVIIRDDGTPTYFASDIAYHMDKYERGYDHIIDVWGTDHHGYVARLKAALQALGYTVEKLEVIIGQLVALYRGKELVRMSKRTGEIVTIDEVMDEIGVDATRYFLVRTGPNTHLDFDLELAKSKSHENPVYYVQYAHARICSIIAEARKKGLRPDKKADLSLLAQKSERALMVKILRYPDEISDAAVFRQPHRLTAYVEDMAAVFHNFYHHCRVVSDDRELSLARLVLVDATRIVIRNVLKLLGVSAPEQM